MVRPRWRLTHLRHSDWIVPMLKSISLAILTLSICVGIAASQGPDKKIDFFPLKVGHRWTYAHTDLKAGPAKADKKQKVVIDVESEEPYVVTKTVEGKAIEEKSLGYVLRSTSGGKTTRDYVVQMKDGLHRVRTAGTPLTPSLRIVPFPLYDKDKWAANSTSGNTVLKGIFTTKVDAVKVPFGEISQALLVSYRDQQPGIEIDSWYAQSVGMVKQRVLAKDHEVMMELEKFEPAK
jgi:hypothetical protein